MRVFSLVSSILLGIVASTSARVVSNDLLFPPRCVCDRLPKNSPYRLRLSSVGSEGTITKICFTVFTTPCDSNEYCCQNQPLYKAEFAVEPMCKSELDKVTVDDIEKSYIYDATLGVLRITQLNKTLDTATGMEICMYTKMAGPCSTIDTFCNKARPEACKYALFNGPEKKDCCPCTNRDPTDAPFQLSDPVVTELDDGMQSYCFTIEHKNTTDYNTGSPCSKMSVYKVEFDVKGSCHGTLAYSSVDGVKKPPFFQMKPYPTIKVNNINKGYTYAEGTEICLVLREPCSDLLSLCSLNSGQCLYGIFNFGGTPGVEDCCPLSVVTDPAYPQLASK
eukprot:gene4608-14801_t